MKKIIFLIGAISCLGFCSCTRGFERVKNNYAYTNPRKEGKVYTVIQNGTEINHLRCIYWGTEDDDSIFENSNGKKIWVNGSSIIIEE